MMNHKPNHSGQLFSNNLKIKCSDDYVYLRFALHQFSEESEGCASAACLAMSHHRVPSSNPQLFGYMISLRRGGRDGLYLPVHKHN